PADDPEATSLLRMLAAARAGAGVDHHFRVLQLPMNLFESSGAIQPAGEPPATVLAGAARNGIGVLLNRPLNAIVGSGMLRLADVEAGAPEVSFEDQLRAVAALEEEYQRDIATGIRVSSDSTPPEHFFRWAEQLAGLRGRGHTLTHWEQIEGQIAGLVGQVTRALDAGLAGPVGERWSGWRTRYVAGRGRPPGAMRRQAAPRGLAGGRGAGERHAPP